MFFSNKKYEPNRTSPQDVQVIADKSSVSELVNLIDIAKNGHDNDAYMVFTYFTACWYVNGKGVAVDKKKAFKYMKDSSEAGNPAAQFQLALFYMDPNKEFTGEEFNFDSANYWMEKSADYGYSYALEELPKLRQHWRFHKIEKISHMRTEDYQNVLDNFAQKFCVEEASLSFNDDLGVEVQLRPKVENEISLYFVAFCEQVSTRLAAPGVPGNEPLPISEEYCGAVLYDLATFDKSNARKVKKYQEDFDELLEDLAKCA
jgi:hypothetical protein